MRTEDYLALDFKDNMILDPHSRREFIKRLGGGIFIFVSLGDWTLAQQAAGQRGPASAMATECSVPATRRFCTASSGTSSRDA